MQFPELKALETPQQPIEFFFDDVEFDLPNEAQVREWLLGVAESEQKPIDEVCYIFCSDERLRAINVEFLDHDYYTDIITFSHGDGPQMRGEMYISTDRVAENAQTHGVPFFHELCRVMVHGLLHLAGYADKTAEQEAIMRGKEDSYLIKYPF